MLSPDQERRLQAVRAHHDKDLDTLLPRGSNGIGGPSPRTSSKRKGIYIYILFGAIAIYMCPNDCVCFCSGEQG